MLKLWNLNLLNLLITIYCYIGCINSTHNPLPVYKNNSYSHISKYIFFKKITCDVKSHK